MQLINFCSKNCATDALEKDFVKHAMMQTNCFEHACEHHPSFVGELSSKDIIVTALK